MYFISIKNVTYTKGINMCASVHLFFNALEIQTMFT